MLPLVALLVLLCAVPKKCTKLIVFSSLAASVAAFFFAVANTVFIYKDTVVFQGAMKTFVGGNISFPIWLLGLDGLNAPFVLLTTAIFPLCVLYSIQERYNTLTYMFALVSL